jgi:hypothetical protein
MRVIARVFPLFLAACLLPSSLLSREANGIWRPPQPPPAGCPTLSFDMELLDISRSMNRHGRFEEAKQRITENLSGAPACSLVVLATFGLTADVRDGGFLTTPDGRSRLLATVKTLRPTHNYTNEDEAAKLIELIGYQLREAYGPQANQLVVRIYSDFESSPSAGKPPASVASLLAGRMGAEYSRLTLEDAPKGTTAEPAAVTSAPVSASPTPEVPRATPRSWPWVTALCCTLGLLVLLGGFLTRARPSRAEESQLEALLITESLAGEAPDADPTSLPERRVEVAMGVPAVFSTDPNSATYIASTVPGAAAGELFRLVPLPGERIRIESSLPGLAVNGAPYRNERNGISLAAPIRIQLGPRTFAISGVIRRPRPLAGTDVFEAEAFQR